MSILNTLIERAQKNPKVIVLPEGQDPRVVVAANKAVENKVVRKAIVLGSEKEIAEACAKGGVAERKFETLDYLNSELFADFSAEFCKMREKKGMTPEKATETMKSRIYFGAMMCRRGIADGLVAGSIASTADMLRAAFHCIGTAQGIKIASSCFVMDLKTPTDSGDDVLLFADCGVNPNPTAEELVDIALATGATYRALIGKQPKVAFLSFSTKGSADHEILNKVKEAAALAQEKIANEKLDIVADGELQADAALVPGVAAAKAPNSPLAGGANILIFPDLNAGNICYKLVQRLAKADAYGPILQGLAKPLNDLSRGCVADDIFGQIVITVCQAG
ncbi:MAG: phosphate acetyltransferase [Victivallales bacterium]|jgi:phosphate acetyltransferase|nr:phosphate acetyltransferase [Victivallales bacterium]